ncbi:MAG: cadherin repeat domain-containing protein, partial [Acidimicrobiia bacterium]|nr:cadherin repeat domain-containing protein [Acidimicrobiia bacterium]
DACTDSPDDCSIAGAVAAANDRPGADTIVFNIPTSQCPDGVCKITLVTGGMLVEETVTIDATTQPQGSGPQGNVCATETGPSRMRVELVGPSFGAAIKTRTMLTPDTDYRSMLGLGIESRSIQAPQPDFQSMFAFQVGSVSMPEQPDGTTIRGFSFTGTSAYPAFGAILMTGGGHNVTCNHFGIEAAGTTAAEVPHIYSVILDGADNSFVGTNGDGIGDIGEGNLFGGALDSSLLLYSSDANRVAGNRVSFAGDEGVAWFVATNGSSANLIGSDLDGVSDELEGNYFTAGSVVHLDGADTPLVDNQVVGNTFGGTEQGQPELSDDTGLLVDFSAASTGTEIRSNTFEGQAVAAIRGEELVLVANNHFGSATGTVSASPLEVGGGSHTVSGNVFRNIDSEALFVNSTDPSESVDANNNCFVGNTEVLRLAGPGTVVLANNWYGASDGPSGLGSGSGDPVNVAVDFDPWLESPPEACNTAPVLGGGEFSVEEDVPVGTFMGSIPASDDGVALSYAITAGNTGNAFGIDSASGEITIAAPLDFETTAAYALTVEASDPFAAATATVTIDVVDTFEVPATATFIDVPLDHTFSTPVEWLAFRGITKGCNPPVNDSYCPDAVATRGEMAAFLHRSLRNQLTPGPAVTFSDIAGSTFEADILWLGSVGATKGCNPPANDMYCPDQEVTRGQAAALMVRAFGLTEGVDSNPFNDDDTSVYEADIEMLVAAGITKGCNPPTNDMYCPDAALTRAQLAAFLYRALYK